MSVDEILMKINDTVSAVRPATEAGKACQQGHNDQPRWKPGQILQAEVTETRNGKVALQINGREIMAQSQLGLRKGQQLLLHVTTTSGEIQLQTLGLNSGNRQETFLQLLGAGWKLPDLMRKILSREGQETPIASLREALNSFIATLDDPTGKVDGSALAALFRRLGFVKLKQEEKTADLRQALKALFDGGEEILPGLDMTRQYNLQLLPEGIMMLPFPLPFLEQGFMVTEQPPEEEDEHCDTPTKVRLFLSLEQLGDIRVDMLWDKEELLIKFTCEKSETLQKLSDFSQELKQMLHFMPLQEVIFTAGQVRTEETLMGYLGSGADGFVNTRI